MSCLTKNQALEKKYIFHAKKTVPNLSLIAIIYLFNDYYTLLFNFEHSQRPNDIFDCEKIC